MSVNECSVSVKECADVMAYAIPAWAKRPADCCLAVRFYCLHALASYFQWKEKRTVGDTHWHSLILSTVHGRPTICNCQECLAEKGKNK